jgi:tetratricopeptide (TPR) repeat protein/DNA-binding SARP family transcriptional activator
MVEIRVLGPVEVWAADQPLEMGPPQQRAVLATLAVDAGRVLSRDALVYRIWGEWPPQGALPALYAHIARIRGLLRSAGASGDLLGRRAGGYVLQVDPEQVDLHRFRRLTIAARDQERSDNERARLLREALDLWRGTPLADLSGQWAARMRDSWDQQRLDAVVAWGHAELRLGRPDQVISPVRELVADYPLNEPLIGLLMRALTATGRDAEALNCYAATRDRLRDKLGTEPGPELQRVHLAILRGELPTVSWPHLPAPIPAQLPTDVHGFTGRDDELDELDRLLIGARDQSTAVVISAVAGTAGVGKTALAVRWAHRRRDAFPDGQLYVDLRGYDPNEPMSAENALAGFLTALGVAGQDIPLDVDDRAARYRTEISGRRMLVILDNAASVEQVRPLLPGTPSCVVVVTSRNSLGGLVARHGARRLDLDLLPLPEAITLLRKLIGGRVKAEPQATATLAAQCTRLPLALRVAAELATARPTTALADLVSELTDEHQRLDLLDAGGDPRAAIRTVFSWSYRHLPADAARVFRLLGLHPGPGLDLYVVAALADTTLEQTRRLCDTLARAYLIHLTSPGRYGMHDLLRAYATELTTTKDSEADRRTALTRLFDYYLATTTAAIDALSRAERRQRPPIPPTHSPTPPLADQATALAWLDAERPNLVAVCAHTAAHGWPGHTTRLATTLFRYLDAGGHFPDALSIHTDARHAAGHTGDRAAEAHALASLGVVYLRQGRYEQAADHYRQALRLFQEAGDRAGEARTLTNLGLVHWHQGRYQQAADHHRQALSLFRETGNRLGEANALSNLGLVHWRRGRYQRAADHHRQALLIYRETGRRFSEANALANLGVVYLRQGRYEQAADHLQRALTLFRETGNRIGEAYALANLGVVYLRQGRYEQAADHHRQALSLFRQTGNRDGQAEVLNGVGETLYATGQPEQARTQHAAALTMAVETGDQYQQARAHTGLAHTHHVMGEHDQARHHWQQALSLYTDLGVPDAKDVHAHLAALHRAVDDDGARGLTAEALKALPNQQQEEPTESAGMR